MRLSRQALLVTKGGNFLGVKLYTACQSFGDKPENTILWISYPEFIHSFHRYLPSTKIKIQSIEIKEIF